ncbi:MAG TPA: cytochrome C [Burkholderiales bacterium]|nr:cytochrome C [Burkholderiales bacterium]
MHKLLLALTCSVALLGAGAARAAVDAKAAEDSAKKMKCAKCHLPAEKKKGGGPPVKDISAKHKADKDAVGKLSAKVMKGGDDHPDVEGGTEADVKKVIEWYLSQ